VVLLLLLVNCLCVCNSIAYVATRSIRVAARERQHGRHGRGRQHTRQQHRLLAARLVIRRRFECSRSGLCKVVFFNSVFFFLFVCSDEQQFESQHRQSVQGSLQITSEVLDRYPCFLPSVVSSQESLIRIDLESRVLAVGVQAINLYIIE
jgi:hypothetical protein